MAPVLIRTRYLVRLSVIVGVLSETAHACATCFGAADSPQTYGMNAAIFTLLGVTTFVLGSVFCFAVTLARRARCWAVENSDSEDAGPAERLSSTRN